MREQRAGPARDRGTRERRTDPRGRSPVARGRWSSCETRARSPPATSSSKREHDLRRRRAAEERLAQQSLGGHAFVGEALVLGQPTNTAQNGGDVGRTGGAQGEEVSRGWLMRGRSWRAHPYAPSVNWPERFVFSSLAPPAAADPAVLDIPATLHSEVLGRTLRPQARARPWWRRPPCTSRTTCGTSGSSRSRCCTPSCRTRSAHSGSCARSSSRQPPASAHPPHPRFGRGGRSSCTT